MYAFYRDSWKKPLDFNVHLSWNGEPHVPFALSVQPEPTSAASASSAFPQFSLLPAELQLEILNFCDRPTLFQLMQISHTRPEAKKLFWSYPDAWYLVDGRWLHEGGFTSDWYFDANCLAHTEQLEVDCFYLQNVTDWMRPQDVEEWAHKIDNCGHFLAEAPGAAIQAMEERIREFWQTLQRVAPRVTYVIMDVRARRREFSIPDIIKPIFHMCPVSIDVSVSFQEPDSSWRGNLLFSPKHRTLWRLIGGNGGVTGEWKKISPAQRRPRIILPCKASLLWLEVHTLHIILDTCRTSQKPFYHSFCGARS